MTTRAGSVAAVDLGATSGRVIVGLVGPDTLETTTISRFPNDPVQIGDGLHWNTVGMYGSILKGLREALRSYPSIASIGIDSWGVDYGLLRNGRLLGEPFHYRDGRNARGVSAVHDKLSRAELYQRNGLQFLPINTVYQLSAEDPAVLALADTALLTPNLIAFWLTGQARSELTISSTTGLLRVDRTGWDIELALLLGIPTGVLPPLIAPGERIGTLTPEVAASLATDRAVPVTAVGSHDTASAVVAVPMTADAAAYVSCGTWGLVGVEIQHAVLTTAARAADFTNERGVGDRVRLLRNVMGLWVLSETMREWERQGTAVDLQTLLAGAADVKPSAVPTFDIDDQTFHTPGDMTARIDAWCHEHGLAPPRTRSEYARSIIESLAQAFADAVRQAGELGNVDIRMIHIVGGGALNWLLCQRLADRAGLPVLAGPVEATALGNLLVQARSAGFISGSLEDLRALVARTQSCRQFVPAAIGVVR